LANLFFFPFVIILVLLIIIFSEEDRNCPQNVVGNGSVGKELFLDVKNKGVRLNKM
jgi:hypothetical protein